MTLGRSFARSLLLAGLTGGLLALAGPPLSSLPIAPLALLPAFLFAPLLAWNVRVETPARAGFLGLAAGFGFGVLSLRFTLDVLARFAGLGVPAALPLFLLLAMLQGLPLALALALARLADTPRSSRLYVTLPLSLAASFGLVPLLFTWHLGHFTLPWLAWAQLAELGGLPLLDLMTSLVGCLALEGLRARRPALGFAALALLLGGATFGYVRVAQVEQARRDAPRLRVGVVQPDVSIRALREGLSPAERLARLAALTRDVEEEGAALTLWPEAAYPLTLSRAKLLARDPSTLAFPSPGGPRVVGAMSAGGRCERWNTLVVTDAAGVPVAHVDKQRLFPFAEYIPLWSRSSWLRARYACAGEQVGEGRAVVQVAGARVGLLNCYEDVEPERAREATRAGAELLANFSNDAWFGRSVQPELHRIVARFRAIETRRDLVRAVNTGGSGHIAATGAELVVLPRHRPGAFVADARLLRGTSLGVRLGDWVPPAALLALLGTWLVTRRGARRGGGS